MNEQRPSVQQETGARAPCTHGVPESTGRELACAGNPPGYRDLPLFSVIQILRVIHHHVHAVRWGGQITQMLWLLAPCPLLGTASSNDYTVGTQLGPFCLWGVTWLQGQPGPYAWLLITYRAFTSDWAYYTNLFTVQLDSFSVFSQEIPPTSSLST